MSVLRSKIINYLKASKLPVYIAEKKFNVGNNTFGRLIDGSIKYPNIESLIKIANGFNCTVDELLDRDFNTSSNIKEEIFTVYNYKLYKSVTNYIFNFIDDLIIEESIKEDEIKPQQISLIVNEIYQYCIDKNLKTINKKLAEITILNSLNIHKTKYYK